MVSEPIPLASLKTLARQLVVSTRTLEQVVPIEQENHVAAPLQQGMVSFHSDAVRIKVLPSSLRKPLVPLLLAYLDQSHPSSGFTKRFSTLKSQDAPISSGILQGVFPPITWPANSACRHPEAPPAALIRQ